MVAQVASLLITSILVWNWAVRPSLVFLPLSTVVAHALLFAALAWFFSAVITFGLYWFLPGAKSERLVWSTFRTAAVAVWFAPACILLSALSPATLVAALVLVITATRLLYSEWIAAAPRATVPATPAAAAPLGLFGNFTAKRPLVTRELCTGLAAALALQSGVISVWRHRPFFAGAWFVLSAAIVTLFAMVSGAVDDSRPPSLPRSIYGMAMTVLLAAGLTVGGLRVMRGGRGDTNGDSGPGAAVGPGAVASAKELLRDLFGDDAPPAGAGAGGYQPQPPPVASPGIAPDGSFPGIILLPEVRPVARLVAPPPKGLSSGAAPARPYGIPFDGPYLLYRWPAQRPPATSVLQHGSPAALGFSTLDHWPLNMEAIQKFDEPIDLGCCRSVRVEIWNADRYPNTVSLELWCGASFVNTAPVRSTPDLKRDPIVAVPETLEFAVKTPRVCNEFKVAFRRLKLRGDKSARIQLERFVLVP
jgi:hypothetical protein